MEQTADRARATSRRFMSRTTFEGTLDQSRTSYPRFTEGTELRLLPSRLQQQSHVSRQDPLAVRAERTDVAHEVAHRLAGADLLRAVSGEHDAARRQFDQRRLHRADRAAEAGGVEHHVVREVM